ncbi:MAG: hypothetical protein GY804_07555 [Alphaproteobacteria bacterium]|nr:hypothetical protein [Alphaproteobacteria bacterium]
MKNRAMNFLGKAGSYGKEEVHAGLVCPDFNRLASNRIKAKHASGAPKASVDPLTVNVLGRDGKL